MVVNFIKKNKAKKRNREFHPGRVRCNLQSVDQKRPHQDGNVTKLERADGYGREPCSS